MREISNSVVTITGGTGSFGSTMLNHLLANGAPEIRIFSRDESKQDSMRHKLQDKRIRFYIGDVRDEVSVSKAIRGSNLVFHAAALKQVPSCEFFPLEAVDTNIHGSANVLSASIENGVDAVVCLSTDKAVYPINAMGMSKALMEKTAMSFARDFIDSPTRIAITRYGNVMASRGSVIPLFIEQIKKKRPMTITNGQMTRFLMNLNQSVELVEYAFRNAKTGDLFVKKAPAATVDVLAAAIGKIFDLESPEILQIGTRHGEKLYESLLSSEEMLSSIDEGGFFRVPLDSRDLNYSKFVDTGDTNVETLEPYTSHNTQRLGVDDVVSLLLQLPEVQNSL